MIDVRSFAGLPIAVMGLGESGLATARALVRSGADVMAWDDDAGIRIKAEHDGVPIADLNACDFNEVRTLVLSPGIPHTYPQPHQVAARALQAKAEIVCDIELLARTQTEATYIGITGTNGKSTTTTLIGHILTKAGRAPEVGGNLGPAVLAMRPLGRNGYYVLEMSSFQLERVFSLAFDVAVLLNFAPNHDERHGGLDGYFAAKRRIFQNQGSTCTAIVGIDDAHCRALHAELLRHDAQRVIGISALAPVAGGVSAPDGILRDDLEHRDDAIMDLRKIATLPGAHNWQNACAAYAAAHVLGVERNIIVEAIGSFQGLPHRQEIVALVDGVTFVNDSKATTPDAAAKALGSYADIYWIAGGTSKHVGYAAIDTYVPRIRHAFLIGAAADEIAAHLRGKAPASVSRTLDRAVADAFAQGKRDRIDGAVVLLSPACASYDQFTGFPQRGETFRKLALALPNAKPVRSAGGAA
ncbi:MAG: UDP-N-acetylmuramoyl-L-alanine--D-glutamate ligase [Alphaproteobacteria bacterium]